MSERQNTFLWGVATSAYQIEGGISNDHSRFAPNSRISKKSMVEFDAGRATDHWSRWEADFQFLKNLGVNSYRFSIEWARLEPEKGRFDTSAFDQYGIMIDRLLELGITPMLTLHHFTHPTWFHQQTPWHSSDSVSAFCDFVREVERRLLDRVPYVITFNEPLVWLLAAYGDAKFPPAERNLTRMMDSLCNMLAAHRKTYEYLKDRHPSMQIGIAHNMIAFRRARQANMLDGEIKRRLHRFYNLLIPRAFTTNRVEFRFPFVLNYTRQVQLDNKIDFWGVNYYYRMHVRFRLRPFRPFEMLFVPRSKHGLSELGWEIYPRGLYKACRWLRFTDKPIIITENGIATEDDSKRVRFLERHLHFMEELRKEGVPIRGYFHWSLMDNFEWLLGTKARFGLYYVNYDNDLERELKPSGRFYANHITTHP
jgi:beta-glucosidase